MDGTLNREKSEALAFTESLVERYQARLRAFIYSRVRDKDLTNDLAQDVFLVVMRQSETFDGSRDPWPWLVGIARNKLFEYWRSCKRDDTGDGLETALIEIQIERESLDRDIEWHERRLDALKQCVDQLEGDARTIIRMTYEERMRSEQLAALLKRKATGVRVTLFRIREQLMQCISRRLVSEVTP